MKRSEAKDKVIENGVIVPASLQVNELTLKGKQLYTTIILGKPPMTQEEAEHLFDSDEIADYFGPAK